MSPEQKEKIHKNYGIVLTAATLAGALCLMAACLLLYRHGAAQGIQPFSRALVAGALRRTAVPVCLALALLLGSVVLHLVLPLPRRPVPRRARPISPAKAPKAVRVTRWSILSGAVLAIAIGLLGGGAAAVIANAIAICTSCIGLG